MQECKSNLAPRVTVASEVLVADKFKPRPADMGCPFHRGGFYSGLDPLAIMLQALSVTTTALRRMSVFTLNGLVSHMDKLKNSGAILLITHDSESVRI